MPCHGSLPHRQFRKFNSTVNHSGQSSLPHRQFRNVNEEYPRQMPCSLSHRQFRNSVLWLPAGNYRSLPYRQFKNHLFRCLLGLWGSLPYKHSFVICSIRTRDGEISADCHIFFKNSFSMCHILSSLNDIINENISI